MQLIKTYTPADANLTGFASNVTGAAFTLTASVSGDSLAHQVSIRNDSATDHSGKTVTLVGTDHLGRALTEVVTGPAGSATVESSGYFLTLTSATPSATIGADTFDIGWVDEFVTPTIALDWRSGIGSLEIVITGTINIDLDSSNSDLQNSTDSASWFVDTSTNAGVTASKWITFNASPRFIRVKANSYSSGATVKLLYAQSNV
jgi:hypothetical protein